MRFRDVTSCQLSHGILTLESEFCRDHVDAITARPIDEGGQVFLARMDRRWSYNHQCRLVARRKEKEKKDCVRYGAHILSARLHWPESARHLPVFRQERKKKRARKKTTAIS